METEYKSRWILYAQNTRVDGLYAQNARIDWYSTVCAEYKSRWIIYAQNTRIDGY